MKSLLYAHWEKLVLGFAVLLVGLSAVGNLVLVKEPAAAVQGLKSILDLDACLKHATPPDLPIPTTLAKVRQRLEETPGTFPLPNRLVTYPGGHRGGADYPIVEGASKNIPLSEPATAWKISTGAGCVSVCKVSGEEDLEEFRALRVEAKQPGTATITLKYYTKPVGSFTVTVKAKTRIELWPPVLQEAQVSPVNPGEVTLTWTDDPRTSFQMTLGYVIERRALPDGAFHPVLGAGRMLPAGTTSYVDGAEPDRQYEYRVIAVGDPAVTQVMPEP